MFEEKKMEGGRSVSFRVFPDFPWVVRAYIALLIIILMSIVAMRVSDYYFNQPIFDDVVKKLVGFLELVIGAVIGALSVAAKQAFSRRT